MRVYSVPASAPFLHTVVLALVDGELVDGFQPRHNPELLADATLYLPTRRACRLVREVFLDVLGHDAVLLPRIVPVGDIDEDELAFAQDGDDFPLGDLDVPPSLGGMQRRLQLARLIAVWSQRLRPGDAAQAPLVASAPASTLALADDLARLMDDMITRGVDWRALDNLVPDALDKYWQLTLEFLTIAKETWPAYLHEIHRIEPAQRRDLLIEAEAVRLMAQRSGPVIAAGSTGSMPATAKFLHAVARLPHGAVVLPGLDTDLDEPSWQSIGGRTDAAGKTIVEPSSNHPQFAMQALLARFGITRADVLTLGKAAAHHRELLASEAMRPASSTAQWRERLSQADVAAAITAGMKSVSVIEAPNSETEALAIAAVMREAREHDLSAALVTPDRALARRVLAALGRWNLTCDDSGGERLMDTETGIFARLVAEAAAKGMEPPTLLALLKHPLCRGLGARRAVAIEALELAVLRGPRPPKGTHGLVETLKTFRGELGKFRDKQPSLLHGSEPRTQLRDFQLDAAQVLVENLQRVFAPLEEIDPYRTFDFSDLARRHRNVLLSLALEHESPALGGPQGTSLASAFDELLPDDKSKTGLLVKLGDYPDVFQTAFADRVVRRPELPQAKLRIYGPLDARLIEADRVILGGLVEGVWPPSPRIDPWLSRPMRHALGLDLPERRIGLSAHDFAQLLGHREVFLSYASKVGSGPAVASRFVHRLEAVAGEQRWRAATKAGERYLGYADALDRPAHVEPITPPQPKPPRDARPQRLSVTAIEDWLRDPYTIYAKYILRLQPLDPVDMPLSAADRGSAIHDALGDFTQAHAASLPADPAGELRVIGLKHFAPLMDRPEAKALWWPRFLRIAAWFAGWERERRVEIARIDAETSGVLEIPLDNGRLFKLTARADRIERRTDGRYAIVDYKTGAPPSSKQVALGLSPQLTLEAAILRGGGFNGIAADASVAELMYVRLSGNNPPGLPMPVNLAVKKNDEHDPDKAADYARARLEGLVRKFERIDQPYNSLVLPMWSTRYGTYDDLARIKEWSAGGLGEDIE